MTKVAGHGVNEQNVVIKELRNHLVSHQTPDVAIVSNDNLKSGTIAFGRKMKGYHCKCLSRSSYKSKKSIFQLNSFHFYQLSCQGTKNMKNTERMDCSGLNMTVTNTFQLLFILHLVRQRVWNIDSHQKNILKQLNWRIMRQLNKKMPEALAIKKTWTCGCFDSESDHANVFMFSE